MPKPKIDITNTYCGVLRVLLSQAADTFDCTGDAVAAMAYNVINQVSAIIDEHSYGETKLSREEIVKISCCVSTIISLLDERFSLNKRTDIWEIKKGKETMLLRHNMLSNSSV